MRGTHRGGLICCVRTAGVMPALTYVYGASLGIGGIFAYQGQWKIGM